MLSLGAYAYGAYYAFLLWKTLSAVDLKPIVWGFIAEVAVLKDLSREEFFCIDGANNEVAARRESALDRMSAAWAKRWPKSIAHSKRMMQVFSDLRFKASGFESTFPVFQKVVNDALPMCTVVERTEGTHIVDVDGQELLDSSGSYGVNCFGHTHFKRFMDAGNQLAQQVGPLLGPMHPVVTENIEMLMKRYRKDEVSFHMSGTEAVMCAVQQVRFHTQRPLIVVFKGAYHGWWDGIMQGAGNPRFNWDCVVVKDKCPASLEFLKTRASEIAGVVVNPVAGMGWGPAATSGLNTGGGKVKAGEQSFDDFRKWLSQLRQTCTATAIPLIFDETWAFQLGPGGAQDLYGVDADIVTLGKAIGGGHAVGAVCGSHRFMERRDPDRPMRVSFVVGTFKGSPMVMGSMNAVLKWVSTKEAVAEFNGLKDRVAKWTTTCNKALSEEGLPISVAAYRNMWCVCYEKSSAYHFLFHCYLKDAGLQLVWVGTGKALINLEFSEKDLEKLTGILVSAAKQFKADGWWWDDAKAASLLPLVLGPTFRYHSKRFLNWLGLGK
jgi:glutamate-1-semialdehyde 2,1-aminomutase